ncbi:hypothetical protein H8M03_11690 [Sphingomonas sabuli]|uniref:Uncharacterized protein n=1 Tax=Sphingomonas sabuli TaxID=2764186 RepID=A0A7G9L1Z4_9SPHN|nr:hypothetical protein [Sphingomonas sabuli]QNM82643.1 hypothetical protein H8M03_11690 [Sphingomonas sabuli]
MRPLLLLPLALLAGCASPDGPIPSLAPRAAESIDPRVPVADPVVAAEADPQLVQRLNTLVAQAEAGDRGFQSAASAARSAVASAGAAQGEGWVAAQQALSRAVAARAPVALALSEIDSLAADRLIAAGGIGAANLRAIGQASAQVSAIDEREVQAISQMQAALRR